MGSDPDGGILVPHWHSPVFPKRALSGMTRAGVSENEELANEDKTLAGP